MKLSVRFDPDTLADLRTIMTKLAGAAGTQISESVAIRAAVVLSLSLVMALSGDEINSLLRSQRKKLYKRDKDTAVDEEDEDEEADADAELKVIAQ